MAWEKQAFFVEGETARLEAAYPGYPITVKVTSFGQYIGPESVKSAIEAKLREQLKSKEIVLEGTSPPKPPFDYAPRYFKTVKTKSGDEKYAVIILIMGDTGTLTTLQFSTLITGNKKFEWSEYYEFARKQVNKLIQIMQQETQVYFQKMYNPMIFQNAKPQP